MGNLKPFKKGEVANPGGRPKILPEIRRAIEANRNALKVIVMNNVDAEILNQWIKKAIEKGLKSGNIDNLRSLLEIGLGKVVEEAPDFPLTEREKLFVLELRRRDAAKTIPE